MKAMRVRVIVANFDHEIVCDSEGGVSLEEKL
jgi:hypothetical protein